METASNTHAYVEDEISLIDLWMVLVRRKRALLVVFSFVFLVAILLAAIKKDKYQFSISLEIGSVMEDGKPALIDQPETVLAKIQEGYIPAVLSDYANNNPDADLFEITARVPKGSDLVVVEAKEKESNAELIKSLEGAVVDLIKMDHSRIIELVKSDFQADLEKKKRALESVQEQQKMLLSDLERNKVLSTLLERQVADVKSLMDDAISSRKKARGSVGDATSAMTLLMIDNEIDQNRKRLAGLEERLQVNLPKERENLQKSLSDNAREQSNIQTAFEQVSLRLKNVRDTRALIQPTQSLKPVGKTKPLILLLGMIFGLIMGIFAAFFAEFLSKAREQLKAQSTA